MNSESIETQLARVPLRELPADWKAEILNRAQPKRSRLLAFYVNWRNLLWPSPWAWATLGFIWLGIAGLNFSGPRGESLYATALPNSNSPEFSPAQYAAYSHFRARLLAVLQEPTSTITLPQVERSSHFYYEIH